MPLKLNFFMKCYINNFKKYQNYFTFMEFNFFECTFFFFLMSCYII